MPEETPPRRASATAATVGAGLNGRIAAGDQPHDNTIARDVQVGNLTLAGPDLERAVLSGLLYDNSAFDKVAGWLYPEHFQIDRYRWIYAVIGELRDAGRPADFVTVPDELQRRGQLDDVGGAADILELLNEPANWWEVEDYARRLVARSANVKAESMLRQGIADLHRNGDGAHVLERIAAGLDDLRGTHITVADFEGEPDAGNTMLGRLIVPMPDFGALGLVGEIADLIHDLTQSARSYCLLTAVTVVATATRRRARLRLAHGDVWPNIYGALLGASSVFHKSTVMSAGRDLLWRAQLTDLIVPSLPTSEGLINRMENKPAGVIFRDEIGTLFGSNQVKYLALLKQDLMALYECKPYGRELSQRGEVTVNEPFLSILGTTTPTKFFETVSHQDWHDGFLVRWLIALPDAPPDFDAVPGLLTDDLDKRVYRLALTLSELSRKPSTDFAIDKPALDRWHAWRQERMKAAYAAGDDVALSFAERYAAYGLKVAILLAASTDWGRVTCANLESAIKIVEHFETCILTLRDARSDFGVSGGKMQRLFAVIRDRGPDVTTKDVYRFAHMPKAEAEPVIDKLLDIGAIIEKRTSRGGGKTFSATTDRLPVRSW